MKTEGSKSKTFGVEKQGDSSDCVPYPVRKTPCRGGKYTLCELQAVVRKGGGFGVFRRLCQRCFVLSNDETAFCRINAARREVRSGGELHKGPPQQHRHRPRQRDPCVGGRWVFPDMRVQGNVRQPSRVVSLNRDVIPQKPLPRSSRIQFIFRSQDQPPSSSITTTTTTTTTRPMRCSAMSLQGTGYYRYDEDPGKEEGASSREFWQQLVFHQPRLVFFHQAAGEV